jgi:hypothetical protein
MEKLYLLIPRHLPTINTVTKTLEIAHRVGKRARIPGTSGDSLLRAAGKARNRRDSYHDRVREMIEKNSKTAKSTARTRSASPRHSTSVPLSSEKQPTK